MVRPMLPTLSYFINMLSKLFDVFASYLGVDLTAPEGEETEEEV